MVQTVGREAAGDFFGAVHSCLLLFPFRSLELCQVLHELIHTVIEIVQVVVSGCQLQHHGFYHLRLVVRGSELTILFSHEPRKSFLFRGCALSSIVNPLKPQDIILTLCKIVFN